MCVEINVASSLADFELGRLSVLVGHVRRWQLARCITFVYMRVVVILCWLKLFVVLSYVQEDCLMVELELEVGEEEEEEEEEEASNNEEEVETNHINNTSNTNKTHQ